MNLERKNVLVTGADGFIGSHLVEALVALGARVRAFVFYNSFNSWGWLDRLPEGILKQIEVVVGDVRDPSRVRSAVRGSSVVFHLAALIGIPFSYEAPRTYVDTNVGGTLNVLDACRDCGAERVMVTSTSEVYGTARYVPIDEEHPYQGQSPYSATKIGADRLAESYYRSFGLPVCIVRPFNTYGPRQSERAIIPAAISQLLGGSERVMLGNVGTSRDMVYVKDTVAGFISLACCDDAIGQEVNIATQTEIGMRELVGMLIDRINPIARIESDERRVRPAMSEVQRLVGSNQKIHRLTGWTPRYSIHAGLEETIEWFRVHRRRNQTRALEYTV